MIAVGQCYWTAEATVAIEKGALPELEKKNTEELLQEVRRRMEGTEERRGMRETGWRKGLAGIPCLQHFLSQVASLDRHHAFLSNLRLPLPFPLSFCPFRSAWSGASSPRFSAPRSARWS